MKILYAIQGTGNGHISRAHDVIPEIQKFGKLDLFVSGAQSDIKLPYPVKYTSQGLSFFPNRKGGIDFIKTAKENSTRRILKEINDFPIESYDLVINDFEPISAWACKRKNIPCIALSHQSAFLSKKSPRPKVKDPFGEWILKNYAPVNSYVGFHFAGYDKNIFSPVVRAVVRESIPENHGHISVYLPAYDDKKLVKLFMHLPGARFHIFSKHVATPYHIGRISVFPIDNLGFVESVVSSAGVICGAGFETPAEVLYLKKKLLVIPMKNQYEQQCNAAALKQLGVPVIKKLKNKSVEKIKQWLDEPPLNIEIPDITEKAVIRVMTKFKSDFN
ncbi:MAG: glycosyl transferase [Cyclobacteriaceae bacterium]|jgi:uncharacterized protein (TIGR00661 family)|nr:glycosyl transferase [Cyclobacteriaceae bacterium]